MKLLKIKWLPPGLLAAAFLLAGLFLFRPASSGFSAVHQQAALPSEGWRVCGNLGIGQPPGGPANVQLMLICNGDDWEVRTYCLEPAKPAPAINTGCSLNTSTNTFWCGDSVQLLRLYQFQQTPPPAPTLPPSTATPLPTSTSVPTNTPLPTPQQPGSTPQASATPAPGVRPTVFVRPNAGGPTNLLPALAFLAAGCGMGLLLASRLLVRRK